MSELRFVPHVHQAGDSVELPYPIVNALAWWVTAELIRRHPNTLRVLETHPGGGQYDCLSLFRRDGDRHNPELVVHLNRSGSITPNSWFHSDGGGEPDRFNWLDVLATDDRRAHIVEQLEQSEGLGSPKSTPPTNRRSVGPRVLARFAASASLTTRRWDIRNGYLDTSGEEVASTSSSTSSRASRSIRSPRTQEVNPCIATGSCSTTRALRSPWSMSIAGLRGVGTVTASCSI